MPSWFAKVFGREAGNPSAQGSEMHDGPRTGNPILLDKEEEPPSLPRRVVEAPVLVDEKEETGPTEEVRIKARVDAFDTCTFLVDRPVFEGHSLLCTDPEDAYAAPLAQTLFEVAGIQSVLLHSMTVTVTRNPLMEEDWESTAREIGSRVRAFLQSGRAAVSEEFTGSLPPEDEIRRKLESVLDTAINPGIAGHGGSITIERIEGNTVYIQMRGGCQGCAASRLTLRDGVARLFRDAVPSLGAVLDVTDHSAGKNPYYTEAPAEV